MSDRRDARLVTLAGDLSFPEGPVHVGRDDVVFVEISGQRVSRWRGGRVEPVATTGGGANGATASADRIFVANNGGVALGPAGYWFADVPIAGRIQWIDGGGEIRDLATELPGTPPRRPNDLCFGPDGLLYFTDPHNWDDIDHLGAGRVCRTDPAGRVEWLADVAHFPNGIGFDLEERLLVSTSVGRQVLAFPCSPGGLGAPSVSSEMPDGDPDGFCLATDGTLYLTGSSGDRVGVFARGGDRVDTIHTGPGSSPTNCCLGDGRLYITLSGTGELVALDTESVALHLHDESGHRRATRLA